MFSSQTDVWYPVAGSSSTLVRDHINSFWSSANCHFGYYFWTDHSDRARAHQLTELSQLRFFSSQDLLSLQDLLLVKQHHVQSSLKVDKTTEPSSAPLATFIRTIFKLSGLSVALICRSQKSVSFDPILCFSCFPLYVCIPYLLSTYCSHTSFLKRKSCSAIAGRIKIFDKAASKFWKRMSYSQ